MRVTTNQLYSQSLTRILELQAGTRSLQGQISSGKRIQTPSDDPVGSAAVMQIQQQVNASDQYARNGAQGAQRLTQVDDTLGTMTAALQHVRDLAVQGRSEALGASDRLAIAKDIREQLDVLVDLGNARNATGEYIFAGAQTTTRPFTIDAAGAVTYNGDQKVRELQISQDRSVPEGFSGEEAMMAVRNGNGTFVARRVPTNTGTGQVSDNVVVNGSAYVAHDFRISFTSPTTYDLIDDTLGTTVASAQPYQDGAAIPFNGSKVTVIGAPAAGDQFTIKPSANQSMFATVRSLAVALETGYSNPSTQAGFGFDIDRALEDLDQALSKMSELRSTTGARLNSISAQSDANDLVNVNLQTLRSKIEDVDLASAISALTQETTALQAAQQAFVKVHGLSLFNYLN